MPSSVRTIFITGATDGIGRQTALQLASQGFRLLLHGRDVKKGEKLLNEVAQAGSPEAVYYNADFASLQAVAELVERIALEHQQLDVLINNAGVYSSQRLLSADGFELTFAVNHLAPFLLTTALLDLLKKSAPARIVNVTSIAYRNALIPYEDLTWQQNYNGWKAYKASKFALVLTTFALSRRLEGSRVTANCLHPGAVDTKMLRSVSPDVQGISAREGAAASVYLATSPSVQGANGLYFENNASVEATPQSRDISEQEKLWRFSEELISPYRKVIK